MYTRISARHPNTTVHAFSAKPSEFGLSDNKKASFVEHCRLHPSFDNRQSVYTARHLYVNQKKKHEILTSFATKAYCVRDPGPQSFCIPLQEPNNVEVENRLFRSVCSLHTHYERIMRNLRPKSRSPQVPAQS